MLAEYDQLQLGALFTCLNTPALRMRLQLRPPLLAVSTVNGMERGMEHGMERGTDVKCRNEACAY